MADQQTAGNGGEPSIVTMPEHIDIRNARAVAEELEATFDAGATVVIADLTETATCSAAGVHELDLAHQRAAARNIDMRLVIPPGDALRVFALTGHDRWLPIYPDLAAALAGSASDLPGRRPGQPGLAVHVPCSSGAFFRWSPWPAAPLVRFWRRPEQDGFTYPGKKITSILAIR